MLLLRSKGVFFLPVVAFVATSHFDEIGEGRPNTTFFGTRKRAPLSKKKGEKSDLAIGLFFFLEWQRQ